MKLRWSPQAWESYEYWHKTDKKIASRINKLIENIKQTPFRGIGKPEPLKLNLSGKWSRRITEEHRLVYEVVGKEVKILYIIQCQYHY